MGSGGLSKPVIERNFERTIHFGRVKMKPGKPTTFATIPNKKAARDEHTPVVTLPGGSVSALTTFYLFVLPVLRRLGGWKPDRCPIHAPKYGQSARPSSDRDLDNSFAFPDSGHNALGSNTGFPERRFVNRR